MEEEDAPTKQLGTTVSLLPDYVIQKGTCKWCKDNGKDALIEKGSLFWKKGKGQYMKKYHFGCFAPRFKFWSEEDKNEGFLEAFAKLRPEDQDAVNELFGEPEKPKKKVKKKKSKKEEEAEDDNEKASKKQK